MHRASIPANRLPKKAASDLANIIGPILEIVDYFRSEIYRLFFFVIDLLSLFLSI